MEYVPTYFTRPHGNEPCPVVIYNHAHGGDYVLGKDELLAGRSALQSPPYAEALAHRGIAGLCIDAWNFGERRGRTESELFKELLWRGRINQLLCEMKEHHAGRGDGRIRMTLASDPGLGPTRWTRVQRYGSPDAIGLRTARCCRG
jgi:hypothetical protein